VDDFLPFECRVQYFKFRKVLVVSSRDMTLIGRKKWISPNELLIMASSIDDDSLYPQNKGIVRAASPNSGWMIKIKEPSDPASGRKAYCKITFFTEADFKISLFLQKQVAPKTGHLANALVNFLLKKQKQQEK
jgi:hypothetical protein